MYLKCHITPIQPDYPIHYKKLSFTNPLIDISLLYYFSEKFQHFGIQMKKTEYLFTLNQLGKVRRKNNQMIAISSLH